MELHVPRQYIFLVRWGDILQSTLKATHRLQKWRIAGQCDRFTQQTIVQELKLNYQLSFQWDLQKRQSQNCHLSIPAPLFWFWKRKLLFCFLYSTRPELRTGYFRFMTASQSLFLTIRETTEGVKIFNVQTTISRNWVQIFDTIFDLVSLFECIFLADPKVWYTTGRKWIQIFEVGSIIGTNWEQLFHRNPYFIPF